MKNFLKYILVAGLSSGLVACDTSLDLAPVSSISDANFWKTPEQFDAFVSGIHARFRGNAGTFLYLGELRSDIYGTANNDASTFTGEATQGVERLWQHNLDMDYAGVGNFGGFYSNINQINLLINKLNTTNLVTEANKNYYLGIAHGMRAYYYFQMLRTWGGVVIQTEPIQAIDISNLAKASNTEAEVMTLIKADLEKSLGSFGSNYTFRNQKSFWSKAATQMLKAEVFLWTAHRGGGATDATTALAALTDIRTNVPSLALLPSFSTVFASNNKGNNEIIFAVRHVLNEATMGFIGSFVPQTGLITNFYDVDGSRKFDVNTDNWGGILRAPVRIETYKKFADKDTRRLASIQPAFQKKGTGFELAGAFVSKFQGEQNAGARTYTNDFPIYRFADLLLLAAEAKALLGQNPATEINAVRARAFGANYKEATLGFGKQTLDADPLRAILQERLFEFIFEGKRWHDLRRMGDKYVFENTSLKSAESYKLLWPVDRNSLTNNRLLTQTPGYPTF